MTRFSMALAGFLFFLPVLLRFPVAAQPIEGTSTSGHEHVEINSNIASVSEPSGMKCLIEDGTGGERLLFVTSSERHASLLARSGSRGRVYREKSCAGVAAKLPRYQAAMCNLAATAPNPWKDLFAKSHGISLDEICEMATELVKK